MQSDIYKDLNWYRCDCFKITSTGQDILNKYNLGCGFLNNCANDTIQHEDEAQIVALYPGIFFKWHLSIHSSSRWLGKVWKK